MKKYVLFWLSVLLVVIFICLFVFTYSYKKDSKKEQYCGECSTGNINDSDTSKVDKDKTQLPIFKPEFNFREGAKQLILLEDHLFNRRKFCLDCCKKHALAAEGLFEEAMSLDREHKYEKICNDLPNRIRDIIKLLGKEDAIIIGDKVRSIRKPIHVEFADKF